MVTGGGKLLWLKPGARHPADKRPLVACWLILLMWDQETGRETRCTSKAVPCWASQHRAAIFLSSSCPCLTSRRFQVEGRSNEAALGDQDVCFVSVNGHCLWCAAHAVGITAHWWEVLGPGICSGENDNEIIRDLWAQNLFYPNKQVILLYLLHSYGTFLKINLCCMCITTFKFVRKCFLMCCLN